MTALLLAQTTFQEASRRKILWTALAAGVAFLALYSLGLHFILRDTAQHGMEVLIQRQMVNVLLLMGLYAVNWLSVMIAVLITADTLSGEIASGTIQAIATKPIHRSQLLLGKWLGFIGMMTLYIALMAGGVMVIVRRMAGFTAPHPLHGLALMWMEAILLVSVTFLWGTTFSTLTNGVLSLGLHGVAFIGALVEQIGAVTHHSSAVNVGVLASLIMPSEVLWRRAAYEMQTPLVNAMSGGPFTTASVPSRAMIIYAAVFLSTALLLAIYRFGARDL